MKNNLVTILLIISSVPLFCKAKTIDTVTSVPTDTGYTKTGSVERLSPEIDDIIAPGELPEILAGGFDWTEGPLWLPELNILIFSDIPKNIVYQWSEKTGISVYLKPSGYTGTSPRGGESGSNGLLVDLNNRLVLCQHGDRRIARMDASLEKPEPKFITLADRYNGKRLNSPNDAVYSINGDLYFTDPAYGLEEGYYGPGRELDFTGVFRLSTDGSLSLLTDKMNAPNGIGISPDGKKLYVANSGDGEDSYWMVFDLKSDGTIDEGRIFYKAGKGHPDGLKVRKDGIIFATGAGGVWIFTPEGKHLGTVLTGQTTSNCALGNEGKYLYITADDYLMRIRLK